MVRAFLNADDFTSYNCVLCRRGFRVCGRGWSSKKDMPDVESQACLLAICTYFRYCTARITTPSTTKTTPTTRLSVSGFDYHIEQLSLCGEIGRDYGKNERAEKAVAKIREKYRRW